MTQQSVDISHRMQPHYCRECGKPFPEQNTNGTSPHAQAWLHTFTAHNISLGQYRSCSRYCEQRAQYEELQAGIRLYGKGIPHQNRGDAIELLDKLLGPED